MEARTFGVEQRAVREIEEPLARRRSRLRQRDRPAVVVVEIKRVFGGPAEVVLELLPFGADLGGALDDAGEHREILDASDVHAGGAHRLVHGHLLGGPLDVVVELLAVDLGEQLVADEAAGQLDVVHQARRGCHRAEQIDVADHRDIQHGRIIVRPCAQVREQFEALAPVPADLRDEKRGAAANLLLHLVVLLHLRRFGVLEGGDRRAGDELMHARQGVRLGAEVGVMVHLADQAQQAERFELEDTLGGHRLVARQRQHAGDARLAETDERTDDRVGVGVLATDVRHDVETVEQVVCFEDADDGGRLEVGDAAGVLRQRDRGKIKTCRQDRFAAFGRLLIRPAEPLDGREAEPRPTDQLRQHQQARPLP